MSILTINSGSSSLKFGLYAGDGAGPMLSGSATHLGQEKSQLVFEDSTGHEVYRDASPLKDQDAAAEKMAAQMQAMQVEPVHAIGHRMVHGGPTLVTHQPLTEAVLQTLKASVHFAPLHIPPALKLVAAAGRLYPGVPQFACFDTAFHQTMPEEAYTYPLPRAYREAGLRRYGFHGLSYESVVRALEPSVPRRLVIAHLGSGSSVCALLERKSVDTSMGVSPTGGVVMGTRTGDLDPGVLLLIERGLPPDVDGLSAEQTERLVNHDCGLEGLAGESDMQALLARTDAEAKLAVDIFARAVAKTVASYVSVLGGLDCLVFTGGIGEHSAAVRDNIRGRLDFLKLTVRTVAADEDGQIARHVTQMVRAGRA